MNMKTAGQKIDNCLTAISNFFSLVCDIPNWWHDNLPKWFRFIFFYVTMIVWLPVILVVGIPLVIISCIVTSAVETWDEFR